MDEHPEPEATEEEPTSSGGTYPVWDHDGYGSPVIIGGTAIERDVVTWSTDPSVWRRA
jgi:hypothetical protein